MNLGLEALANIRQIEDYTMESAQQAIIDSLEAVQMCHTFDGEVTSIMFIQQSYENLESIITNINKFGMVEAVQDLLGKDLAAVAPSFVTTNASKEAVLRELNIAMEAAEETEDKKEEPKAGKLAAVKKFLTAMWERIKAFFSAFMDRVMGVWTSITKGWKTMLKAGKDAYDWTKVKVTNAVLMSWEFAKDVIMWTPNKFQEFIAGMVDGAFQKGASLTSLNQKYSWLKKLGLEITETGIHQVEKPEATVSEGTVEKKGWSWEKLKDCAEKWSGIASAKSFADKVSAEMKRKMEGSIDPKDEKAAAHVRIVASIVSKVCSVWAAIVGFFTSTVAKIMGIFRRNKKGGAEDVRAD
jgi:hypothetical protein